MQVHTGVARADGQRVRLGRRHPGLVGTVNEQAPNVLEGDAAHELLDVDPPVAEGPALLVRLRDLGLEGDDAFEP